MRTMPSTASPPGTPFVVKSSSSSVTVGWLPPPYENGKSVTMYEFQRIIAEHFAKQFRPHTLQGDEGNRIIDEKGHILEDAVWISKKNDKTMDWASVPSNEWMRFRVKASSEPMSVPIFLILCLGACL